MQNFYFIRHGETDWNRDGLYQGQNDIPLNEVGRQQAREVAQKIAAHQNIDGLFISPLMRARETAEIVKQSLPNLVTTSFVPEFMECQSVEAAQYVIAKKGITKLPSFAHIPSGTESPEDLLARVEKGLEFVAQQNTKHPLIVAHGGIATALCIVLEVDIVQTPNCCLLSFAKNNEKWQVSVA